MKNFNPKSLKTTIYIFHLCYLKIKKKSMFLTLYSLKKNNKLKVHTNLQQKLLS